MSPVEPQDQLTVAPLQNTAITALTVEPGLRLDAAPTPPPNIPPTPSPAPRPGRKLAAAIRFTPDDVPRETIGPKPSLMAELERAGVPTTESTNRAPIKLRGLYRLEDSSHWYWNPSEKRYQFLPQLRYAVAITRQVRTAPWKTQERTDTVVLGFFTLPTDLNRVRDSLVEGAPLDAYRLLQDHPDTVHDMMQRLIVSGIIARWKKDNAPPTPLPPLLGSKLKGR